MPKPEILDQEELKKQVDLTPEQEEAIREQAFAPKKKEEDKEPIIEVEEKETKIDKKEDEEVIGKTNDEILNSEESELSEGEKETKVGLLETKKQEEDTLINTPDADLDDNKKGQKADLVKTREVEASTQFENRVKVYSETKKISIEDAKADLEKIEGISDKYEKDPHRIAEANLALQRLASSKDKEITEIKKTQQQVTSTPEMVGKLVQENRFIIGGKALTKENIIKMARDDADSSSITESMEDEAVYKFALKSISDRNNASIGNQSEEVKKVAITKRAEALSDLSKYPESFRESAKEIINASTDNYLASRLFSTEAVITMVKGERYDDDLKTEGDKRFKEGQEKAKIIEKIPPVGRGKTNVDKGTPKIVLTAEQKDRALAMFESADTMSEKQKFEAYVRLNPKEFGLEKKEEKKK